MPNDLGLPRGPTVNWIVQGFISLAMIATLTLNTWTLSTVQKLDKEAAVASLEIAHIKKDITALTLSINRDLDAKYSHNEGIRLEKKIEDLQANIVRQWDVINKMRSFQRLEGENK